MKLEFIPLGKLSISKSNMRYARKAPDVSDILPTVRARGILQPLLVRPNCEAGHYEIVAGCRRFHAAKIVAAERQAGRPRPDTGTEIEGKPDGVSGVAAEAGGASGVAAGDAAGAGSGADALSDGELLPCAVLDNSDDAAAVEASLIENIARLDPDEVSRWTTFTRLVREGRSVADIAMTFGLPELAVRRVLALGNLLPRIREMYRAEEIGAVTVRHLTMASKSRQLAWLALVADPGSHAPRGYPLKSWLLGGETIPVRHALFDVEASGLALVTDLFGEDAYFADPGAFWTLQNAAVAVKREAFLAGGWTDAVVMGPETHFHAWEFEKTPKRKGGRVYLDVRGSGELVVHEGYLSRQDAARLARSSGGDRSGEEGAGGKPVRAELTALTGTYVDLHRHAAVRAELLGRPGLALRLMVAHAIAGSALWRVSAEPQAVKSDAVRVSLDESRAEAVFDARRREVLALLGLDADEATVTGSGGYGGRHRSICALLARLTTLADGDVLDLLTLVMGETLAAGSPEVEAVGSLLGLSMADWWEADAAFLDTLRDREVLLAMVAEVAGEQVAAANAREKGKALKVIIRAHLAGEGGRTKCEGWVPRWMVFPPSSYTERGGVGTVAAHARAFARPASEADDSNMPDGVSPESDVTDPDFDSVTS
ncbi:ParB/RepB/Spo0J family partition protein [Novosphingobium sp.]|jgi:ParB family chromosome partitioning protein|uniref:ParB/RepB/Spo0J family partition protein n=1 Tax=Novosphingobium sp. TaxID=1874826 RepID=UPI002FE3A169